MKENLVQPPNPLLSPSTLPLSSQCMRSNLKHASPCAKKFPTRIECSNITFLTPIAETKLLYYIVLGSGSGHHKMHQYLICLTFLNSFTKKFISWFCSYYVPPFNAQSRFFVGGITLKKVTIHWRLPNCLTIISNLIAIW